MLRNKNLLRKFKAMHLIGQVDERINTKLLHSTFNHWRETKKQENPWMKKAILYFATKSPINTSLAVSLWRMKHSTQ